jgi:hypothetical protein
MNDEPATIPRKIGVMVGTPLKNFSSLVELPKHHTDFMEELARLTADPQCQFEFTWATVDMGIVPARNKIVANFLASPCRWLLWKDLDIKAAGGDVLRLLSKKLPVIGGLYTTKEEHAHWVATFLFEAEPQKDTVLQVVECGTGLKLYHREVFEKLAEHWKQISYTDRDTGEKTQGFFQHAVVFHDLQQAGDLLPEDYFCDFLCRQMKIAVWVDSSIKLRHCGHDGAEYPKGDWPPIPGLEP